MEPCCSTIRLVHLRPSNRVHPIPTKVVAFSKAQWASILPLVILSRPVPNEPTQMINLVHRSDSPFQVVDRGHYRSKDTPLTSDSHFTSDSNTLSWLALNHVRSNWRESCYQSRCRSPFGPTSQVKSKPRATVGDTIIPPLLAIVEGDHEIESLSVRAGASVVIEQLVTCGSDVEAQAPSWWFKNQGRPTPSESPPSRLNNDQAANVLLLPQRCSGTDEPDTRAQRRPPPMHCLGNDGAAVSTRLVARISRFGPQPYPSHPRHRRTSRRSSPRWCQWVFLSLPQSEVMGFGTIQNC